MQHHVKAGDRHRTMMVVKDAPRPRKGRMTGNKVIGIARKISAAISNRGVAVAGQQQRTMNVLMTFRRILPQPRPWYPAPVNGLWFFSPSSGQSVRQSAVNQARRRRSQGMNEPPRRPDRRIRSGRSKPIGICCARDAMSAFPLRSTRYGSEPASAGSQPCDHDDRGRGRRAELRARQDH